MEDEKRRTYAYLLHLLRCALTRTVPSPKPREIEWENVFSLAQLHMIANTVYYSVEKLENQPDDALNSRWRQVRDKAALKTLTQQYEAEAVYKRLAAAQIRFMPLKGARISGLYPQEDFRQMSDTDILIDRKNLSAAKKAAQACGFKVHGDGENHLTLIKPPVSVLELHVSMLPPRLKMQARYYADPWAKAHETAPYRYEYGAEDFYIYMTAHFAKHYYFGGSGIRSVADIYVFMKAHGKNLDRGYIKRELEKLGLYEFSMTAEALARHWFAGGEIGGEGKEMERTVLESGVYGTLDGRYLSQYRAIKAAHPKTARIRFVAARLFPPYPEMKTQYRVLSHFKAALPACYVHRIVTAAIFKRSKIKRILKNTKA